MSVELIAVQPLYNSEEQLNLAVMAAEICRGNLGKHREATFEEKYAYLQRVTRMNHLSVLEHIVYVEDQEIAEELFGENMCIPGADFSEGLASFNARNLLEYTGFTTDIIYNSTIKRYDLPPQHEYATFLIECSRACSHQLVRHRMAAYSQESQRHVKLDGNDWYVTPDNLTQDEKLQFYEAMVQAYHRYETLLKMGVKKEDARAVLPNATKTKILVTTSYMWWRHFVDLRDSPNAQDEIHTIAHEIKCLLGWS